MYSRSYKKISVTIKKKNKAGKYKPKKWAEIKVYDNATGRLIDHDIADKNGRCKVYILGNGKKVKLKVASFKGNKTKSFTISGKKVKSKTINWIKNKKYAIKI